MKILLCSYSFHPRIGGIETVSQILAREFGYANLKVTVVTNTPGADLHDGYRVIRRPSWRMLRKLARETDLIFLNNISLQFLLPTVFVGKPVIIAHHTWLTRSSGKTAWQDIVKKLVLRACNNVSISRAIAASLPVNSIVIPNPFEVSDFSKFRMTPKTGDIVFMGRLVSDKGCDQILYSLANLKALGLTPNFTVIGDGEERPLLERLTIKLGLVDQVKFLGTLREDRGLQVAQHKIMVVPSRWMEPFGLVVLEGIAAGCAIVASGGGGLPEAVGPCGLLYPNGDVDALTEALWRLLMDLDLRENFIEHGPAHLAAFHPKEVGTRYRDYFETVLGPQRRPPLL